MAHLAEISCMLVRNNIPHKRIFESDAPYEGALMSIGVEPMWRERIQPLLKDLPSAR